MNGAEPSESSKESPANPPVVLAIEQMSSPPRPWKLALYPAHLTLEPAHDTPPFLVLCDDVMKSATLIEGMRGLALTKPFKVTFKLTKEAAQTLADWIGKPVLAAHYLRRRYGWVLPVAILWVFGSLPMSDDPAAGIEAAPFDPVALVFGVALVAAWACAKWRPHPGLLNTNGHESAVLEARLAKRIPDYYLVDADPPVVRTRLSPPLFVWIRVHPWFNCISSAKATQASPIDRTVPCPGRGRSRFQSG